MRPAGLEAESIGKLFEREATVDHRPDDAAVQRADEILLLAAVSDAKEAFAEFLAGQNLNANQIEFINLIIDHLTERAGYTRAHSQI